VNSRQRLNPTKKKPKTSGNKLRKLSKKLRTTTLLSRLTDKVILPNTLVASEIEDKEIFQNSSTTISQPRELTALLKLRRRTSSTLVINMVVSAGCPTPSVDMVKLQIPIAR
jgi:hypothetical protein